jgi:hypothetical protein
MTSTRLADLGLILGVSRYVTNRTSPAKSAASSVRALSYSLQSAKAQDGPNARPSYQIYGENTAFTIKHINPEFKVVGSGKTIILDKKGRLLLEWVPRTPSNQGSYNKFAWDRPLRFGLSPEEIGLYLARLKIGQSVEFNRQSSNRSDYGNNNNGAQFDDDNTNAGSLLKVFRAQPLPDGTVRMTCDYELDGRGGQDPPTSYESTGPLEINLMAGESQVIQSIMEYSLPRLTGWPTMMDYSIENALSSATIPNPHNYSGAQGGGGGGGGRDDGVPF